MKTPEQALQAYLEAVEELMDNEVAYAMNILGLDCVKKVRDRTSAQSWIDHTGNLRSSVGYTILKGNKIYSDGGFQTTLAPEGNGGEGQREGRNYLEEQISIASFYDYSLILVAGMEYADKVEAIEGKDVLASTELWAKAEWTVKILPALQKRVQQKIDALGKQFGLA